MRSAQTIVALSFLVLATAFRPAVAATASVSFGVSVTVQDACLASASSIGSASLTSAPISAASAVSVNCARSTPYILGLSSELTPGLTVAPQRVATPAWELLGSTLTAGNERIGSCGRTADTETLADEGSAPSFSLLAQIPAEQYAATGAYADSVTISVTY